MAHSHDDPRHFITLTAFNVSPDLLGTPLASPWRRGAALLFDLSLAGMMSLAGFWGAVAIFAAAFLGRLSRRWSNQGQRGASLAFTTGAGVVLCVGLVYGCATREDDEDSGGLQMAIQADEQDTPDGLQVTVGADELDEATRRELQAGLDASEEWLRFVPEDVRAELDGLVETTPDDSAPLSKERRAEEALLLHRFADAYATADSAALDSLEARAADITAGPRLDRLRQVNETRDERIDALEDDVEDLQEELDNPSFFRSIRAMASDLGLTFGWIGFYFTMFLAWTQGYTPGKRILGIRVLRLNGNRIGFWHAFERFGGYFAGLATGLLGFAQVLWDANRQGVHDKIAGTVVIRTGHPQSQHHKTPSVEEASAP